MMLVITGRALVRGDAIGHELLVTRRYLEHGDDRREHHQGRRRRDHQLD
jgi:hypothetical protein